MLQAGSTLEMVDYNSISNNNSENIDRTINIKIIEQDNNERIINMSNFKLEIFNGNNKLYDKDILTNEFRLRVNNNNIDNIDNRITLKDINENIYTKNPLNLNVEDNNNIDENKKYIKISITDNDNQNRNYEKMIQIEDNNKLDATKISYFE